MSDLKQLSSLPAIHALARRTLVGVQASESGTDDLGLRR